MGLRSFYLVIEILMFFSGVKHMFQSAIFNQIRKYSFNIMANNTTYH